jgi:hypothetical protein
LLCAAYRNTERESNKLKEAVILRWMDIQMLEKIKPVSLDIFVDDIRFTR